MQRVTFTSARGETVELYQSPFFLSKIEGLGDVESETQSQRAPEQDGSTPVFTTLEERYIPIEIVILENLLVNRQLISRIFNPRLGPGTLTYDNGFVKWQIQAQSDHVPTFPDDRPRRVQRAMIDLTCYDPYWRDGNPVRTEIAFWQPMFKFALSIDHQNGTKFGLRSPTQIVNVNNGGHTDTGMIIKFEADQTLVNPQLVNVNTMEFIKLNVTMVAGQIITVNTNKGKKTITSNINGVETNAFNTLVFGSSFLQLNVGDNLFRYGADQQEEFLRVTIYHDNKYVGV